MTENHHALAWLDHLQRAWSGMDPGAVGDLFTEDVIYRSSPFQNPLIGREEVIHYWAGELSGLSSVEVAFSTPVIEGDRVAVEWWAVAARGDADTTDSGALILEFTGDLCSRLHEYWMLRDGRTEVPAELTGNTGLPHAPG